MKLFKIVPVVDGISDVVTAITYAKFFLYVGTQNGTIYCYSIAESADAEDLVNSGTPSGNIRLFHKRKIDSLTAIVSNKVLCCLSDGVFQLMPLQLSSIGTTVAKGVSAYCFLHDEDFAPIRLCLAIRRKLYFYFLAESGFVFDKDLSTPDVALALCWDRQWICAAFRKEYALIKEKDGAYSEIFPLDSSFRTLPKLCLLPDNELLLVGQENIGIFFNIHTQQPSKKDTIHWSNPIQQLGVFPPYIVGIMQSGMIEIHSIRDQRLCQRLEITEPSLMSDANNAIFLGFPTAIFCLHPIPFTHQMQKLFLERKLSEALELLNSNFEPEDPRRAEELAKFHLYGGWTLFTQLQFPGAFQHFSYAKLDISFLLAFWKSYLPSWWRPTERKTPASVDDLFEELFPEPLDIPSFIEKRLNDEIPPTVSTLPMNESDESSTTKTIASLVELANSSLATFLLKERLALVSGFTERLDIHIEETLSTGKRIETVLKLVDTLLIKLLVECDDPQWKELVYEPYHPLLCSIEDCSEFFTQIHRFDALAVIMTGHSHFEAALELWEKIYTAKVKVAENCITTCDPLVEIAEILSFLPNDATASNLVIHYGGLLFKGNAQLGLSIFLKGNASLFVSHEQVIDLITLSCDDSSNIIETYLEYIISKQRSVEPSHKTRLASIYIRKVLDLQSELPSLSSGKRIFPVGKEPGKLGVARKKLIEFLETTQDYEVDIILKMIESTWLIEETVICLCRKAQHGEALELLIATLRDISKAETYCHAMNTRLQKYVDSIETHDYQEFRSAEQISFSSIDKHLQRLYKHTVLGISRKSMDYEEIPPVYLYSRDFSAAETTPALSSPGEKLTSTPSFPSSSFSPNKFVSKISTFYTKTGRSAGMLLMLLKKLVQSWIHSTAEEERQFYHDSAIQVLSKYAGHPDLDPLLVTPILPDAWPLSDVLPYYFTCLRKDRHTSFTKSIQENLGCMAYLNTFNEWAQESQKSIIFQADTRCFVCGHGIKNQTFVGDRQGHPLHVQCAAETTEEDIFLSNFENEGY